MRISDVISLRPQREGINWTRLGELREALDREEGLLSLLTSAQIAEILEPYIGPADPAADPLYRFLKAVATNGGRGVGMIVRGPHSSGKTYLLALADLLLEYPQLRPQMAATHPMYEDVLKSLARMDPLLVVPIPLEEHRAHDEHLEDIFFDRTEQELRRRRHNITLPLSEQSYALDLIERHILPRYGSELDAHIARLPGAQRSWKELRERNPAAAVAAARAFAQEIGYPLDFRQSRVERLARLLDIISARQYRGIVWLVDDLGQFLAATGQKAVRNDAAFLEFLGQRSKIAPLYVLATMHTSFDQTASIEPYMLVNILENYEILELGTKDMRRMMKHKVLSIPDEDCLASVVANTYQLYRQAFGTVSFSREALLTSYPLHPLAETCLEAIYSRYLNEADGIAKFFEELRHAGGLAALDRPAHQLLSLADVLSLIASRLSAHPHVAPYFHEALEYYIQNGAQIYPASPDLPAQLARCLIALRLGNLAASLAAITEALGLDEQGRARYKLEQVREALEQMRLRGRYIDVRRGATPETDSYYIDVEASLTELARRYVITLKAALAEDDPRLWEAVAAATSPATLPLADLGEPRLLEIGWANSTRTMLVQTCSLTSLGQDKLAGRAAELADPLTQEDLRLYIAEITRLAEQKAAWQEAAALLPQNRWASGVLAWLPKALSAEDWDRLKEYAACRILLQTPQAQESRVQDRLAEEASRLNHEVRAIVENAYMNGEILSGPQTIAQAAELAPTWGDWPATLAVLAQPALSKIYPKFRDIAPRQPVTAELAEAITAHLLSETGWQWPDEGLPGEWAHQVLAPLQLVRQENGMWRLYVEASEAAAELIERLRRRDQTPEHVPGKPMAYQDLQRYMAKSVFGLPMPLFQLLIAALIRSGYLVALDSDQQIIPWQALKMPLEQHAVYVARAPLLSVSEWQSLTRAVRLLLERMIPRANHAMQTEIWEALCAERRKQIQELTKWRRLLAALWERLGQSAAQWRETLQALEELQAVYEALDPQQIPATSLLRFLEYVSPLLEGSPNRLSQLLRTVQSLQLFFERMAEDLVRIYDYLNAPELANVPEADFQARRQQLLQLMHSGENILREEAAFRRLVQIIFSIYKRRYIAWHTRCHRLSVFDQYRLLKSAPELRVLAHLQRLDIKPEWEGPSAWEIIEQQEAKRCTYTNLQEALDATPTCPQCHLRLDEELPLVPLEQIKEVAEREIAAYMAQLRQPEFLRALHAYLDALPQRGELATRLEQLAHLSENPPIRLLLSLFTDDVIVHLNRVLSGKRIRPRSFSKLRQSLAGRTLSRREAEELFQQWLASTDDDNEDEIFHIEP